MAGNFVFENFDPAVLFFVNIFFIFKVRSETIRFVHK